jgi:hypothetical protein
MTDGEPNCDVYSDDSELIQQAEDYTLDMLGQVFDHGIGTFVIGLGEFVDFNPDLLNQMAEAGGHPRPGPVKYYPATSLGDLVEALDEIGTEVMPCQLDLDRPPDIPEWLWVYFDGEPLSRDSTHQDGWDYDPAMNRVSFYGPACESLRNGDVEQVEVRVGCGEPI